MKPFRAVIQIIGVNPYVLLPAVQLEAVTAAAGRDKGPIPVAGAIDGHPFRQTLVKYSGAWRLYLNTPMRKAAGKDVGDRVMVEVRYDADPRVTPMPPTLDAALRKNTRARAAFEALAPSRQKEIKRYLNGIKTTSLLERHVETVLAHLLDEPRAGLLAVLRAGRKKVSKKRPARAKAPAKSSPGRAGP